MTSAHRGGTTGPKLGSGTGEPGPPHSLPNVGLIINTSEQPAYLRRVLRAVAEQTVAPNEVVLADDGSGEETQRLFGNWSSASQWRTEHVWQKHEGFRRARILNEAIAQAQSEYLVFLDGDTVPHPRFVADHRQLARAGAFIQGHRTLVQEEAAGWFGQDGLRRERLRALCRGQLAGVKHAFRWPWPLVRKRKDLRGVRGCNLAIWRNSLVQVNGYNEAFIGWGREDSELAVRLMHLGLKRLDVRGWALCYHLWHPPASRTSLASNDDLLARAQREGAIRCELGLDQHLPKPV